MRTKFSIFFFLYFCLLFQTTLVPGFFSYLSTFSWLRFLEGHTVDLGFLVLVYLGFVRAFWSGILWASIATVLMQTFGVAWKGSIHFSFFAIIVAANILKRGIVATSFVQQFAIVFGFSVLNALIQLFAGGAFERFQQAFSGMIGFILMQSLLNALLGTMIFRILFAIEKSSDRRFRSDKNIFFNREVGYGYPSF